MRLRHSLVRRKKKRGEKKWQIATGSDESSARWASAQRNSSTYGALFFLSKLFQTFVSSSSSSSSRQRLIGRPGFYVQLDFRSFFFGRGGYFFLLFMAVFARAVSVAAALRPPIGFFLLFFCCRFIGRFFSFAGGDLGGYYWISLALLLRPLLFHRRRSVDIRLD